MLGYHFRVIGFGGGFVGVDVFFVISGFLITQLIARESAADTFSFLHFYERRARRLFPALFAMLAATLIVGWFMLLPLQYRQLGTDAVAASGFAANIKYWLSGGYFDQNIVARPLLHTWSLGVEEQYYLLYPLILVTLLKLGTRGAFAALAVLTVASLAISEATARTDALFAFYMLPSRAWELFLGGLVALRPAKKAITGEAGTLLFASALVMIVAPVFGYSEYQTFPGLAAVIPCAGAAVIIWQGAHVTTAPRKVLSVRALAGLGLISYSLYLWHWPIVTFARSWLARDLTVTESAVAGAASIAVAWSSWRFVERPFRFGTAVSRRGIFAFSFGAALVTAGVGFGVRRANGIPRRLPARVAALASAATEPDPATFACHSSSPPTIRTGALCVLGGESGPPVSFALLGDSHADAIADVIDSVARRLGQRGWVITHGGCPPVTGLPGATLCDALTTAALDRLQADTAIHTVILAAQWMLYASGANEQRRTFRTAREELRVLAQELAQGKAFGPGLRRTFEALAGKHIIFVASVPEQVIDVSHAVAMAEWRHVAPPPNLKWVDYVERQRLLEAILAAPALERQIAVVRPSTVICTADECRMMVDGKVVYRDASHLSRAGALMLQPLLARAFTPAATSSRGRP